MHDELLQKIKRMKLDPDAANAELCRRSLSKFVREFWHTVVQGDELIWNWHMEALCNEIQFVYDRVYKRLPKLHDLIINIPPGTSKSTICTVMAPAWSWTQDAAIRHITGSYSEKLSTEHSVKSRDVIKSDKFRLYFPEIIFKSDEDNKTNYKNTNGGQRFTTSVGGTVTGTHAHIITIDDPLNPKEAVSIVSIKEANDWFDKTLSTRKVNKEVTPTILIMQRLATNDPTGHLLEKHKQGIRHVCLPGELSNNVKPAVYKNYYINGLLDPERLNKTVLDNMRRELGADGYSGQVDQDPVPPGGLIWKKWFIEVPDNMFPDKSRFTQYGSDWDLAYTKDDDNAASAYITGGKLNNDIYIDDIGWDWLEFPELIAYMKTKASPHYIEAKASGKSAKQTLTKSGINAIEVKVAGGADKEARARFSTPPAESGRVFIRKSLVDKFYNDSDQGILKFPRGKHKDLADTLAQFIQRLDKQKTVFSSADPSMLDDINM